MDEKKRQLRRTAAEDFMRSLEQLGELLNTEESSATVASDPNSEALEEEQEGDSLSEMLKDFLPPSSGDRSTR